MTATITLTPAQAAAVGAARAVLAEEPPSAYELGDTAARIGRLVRSGTDLRPEAGATCHTGTKRARL